MRTRPIQPLEHRLLLTATFCLLAGGAVMVYSASSARTVLEGHGDGTLYLLKYLAYGTLGLSIMHVLARVELGRVRRLSRLLLLGAFTMLALVKVPGIGVRVNGATRWLGAGPVTFQPSELMKLALVLHIPAVITARPLITRDLRTVAGPVIGVGGAAVLLIAAQPDLGSCLVIGFTIAVLLVVAGLPVRQLGLACGIGALLVLLFVAVEPYRRSRLTSFLHPWDHATTDGFQTVQGFIAIGSGGLFGNGIGQSIQKIFYVPEAHTDFILTIIGEELGVAGILGLLLLYGLIAYAGLETARNAKGLYATLVAAGITSLILCQSLLNIYAVLGLAPLTGVPLPFISSGSSSLLTLLAGMGVLLNVAAGGHAHTLSAVSRRSRTDHGRRGRVIAAPSGHAGSSARRRS